MTSARTTERGNARYDPFYDPIFLTLLPVVRIGHVIPFFTCTESEEFKSDLHWHFQPIWQFSAKLGLGSFLPNWNLVVFYQVESDQTFPSFIGQKILEILPTDPTGSVKEVGGQSHGCGRCFPTNLVVFCQVGIWLISRCHGETSMNLHRPQDDFIQNFNLASAYNTGPGEGVNNSLPGISARPCVISRGSHPLSSGQTQTVVEFSLSIPLVHLSIKMKLL